MLSATGVSNQIAIKPDVSASAVKREIEEALKRRSTSEISDADGQSSDLVITICSRQCCLVIAQC